MKLPKTAIYITGKELKRALDDVAFIQLLSPKEKLSLVRVEGIIGYHELPKLKIAWERAEKAEKRLEERLTKRSNPPKERSRSKTKE
jgi:hypothetical protein